MSEMNESFELVSTPRMESGAAVMSVRGDIDLHNSPELRSVILEVLSKSPVQRLVLNLSQVPYMDSSAIAVLVEALQRLRPTGGKVMLVDLQPRVKGLLQIARLDSIFSLADTEQQALAM